MNMYGPHALSITEALTARIAQELGYAPDVLLTYQAAYAGVTSNALPRTAATGTLPGASRNSSEQTSARP
jgi:hypothetical protein